MRTVKNIRHPFFKADIPADGHIPVSTPYMGGMSGGISVLGWNRCSMAADIQGSSSKGCLTLNDLKIGKFFNIP
jgi:hypothetical protein